MEDIAAKQARQKREYLQLRADYEAGKIDEDEWERIREFYDYQPEDFD